MELQERSFFHVFSMTALVVSLMAVPLRQGQGGGGKGPALIAISLGFPLQILDLGNHKFRKITPNFYYGFITTSNFDYFKKNNRLVIYLFVGD